MNKEEISRTTSWFCHLLHSRLNRWAGNWPFSRQTTLWGPKRPGRRSMRTATSEKSLIFVGRATCSAWLISQTVSLFPRSWIQRPSPCTSTDYPQVVGNLEDSDSESPQGSRPRAGSVPAPPSATPAVAPAVPAVAALRQRTEAPMSHTVPIFQKYDVDLENHHSVILWIDLCLAQM